MTGRAQARVCVLRRPGTGNLCTVLGALGCCAGLAPCRRPPLNGRVWGQATRAYLHTEAAVEAAFRAAGWKVVRRELTATRFYFSRLFEAVRL